MILRETGRAYIGEMFIKIHMAHKKCKERMKKK